MKVYRTYSKSNFFITVSFFLAAILLLLIFPKDARNGGTNGGYLCIQVLIPSLFPFMVLSDFSVKSGLTDYVPGFFERITRCLMKLPKEAAPAIFLCLIGGYPVGAKTVKALYNTKRISKKQAERMCLFTVASGPGFLVTYVGAVMTRSLKLGYFLLIAQTLSVIFLGIVSRLFYKQEEEVNEKDSSIKRLSFGEALISSVESAIKSTAGLCGLVVLFSAFCEIFITLCHSNPNITLLAAFFEITLGVKEICKTPSPLLLAFFCGFGGLCVHLQIFLSLKGLKINKVVFYLFRTLQGLICSIVTMTLYKLFPDVRAVFSSVECAEPKLKTSFLGCFLLIITAGLFLIILQNSKHYRR